MLRLQHKTRLHFWEEDKSKVSTTTLKNFYNLYDYDNDFIEGEYNQKVKEIIRKELIKRI